MYIMHCKPNHKAKNKARLEAYIERGFIHVGKRTYASHVIGDNFFEKLDRRQESNNEEGQ